MSEGVANGDYTFYMYEYPPHIGNTSPITTYLLGSEMGRLPVLLTSVLVLVTLSAPFLRPTYAQKGAMVEEESAESQAPAGEGGKPSSTKSGPGLIQAAVLGSIKLIDEALERGEDINTRGKDGEDAVIAAMKHYKLDAADHLIKRGISVKNVDNHGRNSLLWAIWRKHVKLAEELIEAGADVNIENPDDRKTPLNYVSLHPHLKEHHHLIHMLVDHGANVNHIDAMDHSPLFLSAMNGHVDCVEALLEHGAHVDHRQSLDGHTPLHVASLNGHTEVVKHLLAHGADTSIIGKDGYTALDLATRNGRRKIVKAIKAAMTSSRVQSEL